jgi:hypothetical protein
MITVSTPTCVSCGKGGQVTVPADGYKRWQTDREYIQVAMPDVSAGDREQLLTGTHDTCWKAMFPE